MTHSNSKPTSDSISVSTDSSLQFFKGLTWGTGTLSALFLLPFSLHLSFTLIQGVLWGVVLLPVLLSFYPMKEEASATRFVRPLFMVSFVAQFILLILIFLGFFWDSTQTPTQLALENELSLQALSSSSSQYLVETQTDYEFYIPGEFGPRLFSVPKRNASIHRDQDLTQPVLRTYTGCSHHWIETLMNRFFGLDEHLSLQKVYEIHLPQS